MPELPQRKVGIVACSGEDLAEGTVTRLAALQVLERLRPGETVTICLPLFLAGGKGDRAFARFYPTIAVDGCDRRCAARATELYSGMPAATVVVTDVVREAGLAPPVGARRLDESGRQAVELTAERVTRLVDELLGGRRDRGAGSVATIAPAEGAGSAHAVATGQAEAAQAGAVEATCSCATAIPAQTIDVAGHSVALAALPLIFEQFREAGKEPGADVARELLATVRIYNDMPAGTDDAYAAALEREYAAFCSHPAARQ